MMKNLRGAMLASAVALAWCLGASTAIADDYNRETVLTINQTMMVPGAMLTPGTYTFKLANPESSRDVVYITRDDGTVVTSANVKRTMQRNGDKRDLALAVALNEGAMPVMKGWFYPGLMDGFEFVYPKEQARTIARAETVEISVAPRG
jgi:hypothetical protein